MTLRLRGPSSALLFIVLFPAVAVAQEMQPTKISNAVDYVAKVTSSDRHSKRTTTRTITHSGDWTTIQTPFHSGAISEVRTSYFNVARRLVVNVTKGNDPLLAISITRNPKSLEPFLDYRAAVKTEATDTALGENCTVWTFAKELPTIPKQGYTIASCVTADGIELWRRAAGLWDMQLTHLERRPVAPHEVQPPAQLLAEAYTFVTASSEGSATFPDHEVVLQGRPSRIRKPTQDNMPPETVTVRRRCPWSYEKFEQEGVSKSISTHNPKLAIRATYVRNADGFEHLHIRQDATARDCGYFPEPRPMRSAPPETVHGELCHWHDMTPGMMDASQSACFTPDNIMMKSKAGSRGAFDNVYNREAIHLRRGPLALKDVLLPSELLSAEYWELPAQ